MLVKIVQELINGITDRYFVISNSDSEIIMYNITDKLGRAYCKIYIYLNDPIALYISDLIVVEDYRKQNIGKHILTLFEYLGTQLNRDLYLWVEKK